MKKAYFVYVCMAVFCVALLELAKFLIQKGFLQDDTLFWFGCFLGVGIALGRLSVYIEYEYKDRRLFLPDHKKQNKKLQKHR